MGQIVNLAKARKAKTKAEHDAQAQANRAKFGRTRAEKVRDRIETERAARLIDGAQRDKP